MKNNNSTNKIAFWTLNKKKKFLYDFKENELNHLVNLYKKYSIVPESLSLVKCDFLIQKTSLVRHMIKQLDILLDVEGVFEMDLIDSKFHSGSFLSIDQVKYEFSISTNGRYILNKKKSKNGFINYRFIKKSKILNLDDSITCWTFGIPFGGKNSIWVEELILSIVNQKIPNYEIIICGPYRNKEFINKYNIKIIADVKLENDIRIPICHKKNKIIKNASFQNICILHDRFLFQRNWYIKMKEYGNYFDYLCLPTMDLNMNRFDVDWMEFNFPISQKFKRNKSFEYSKWSPNIIIQGGVVIGKADLLKKHLLDERIHWGELEDMHLSKVAYLDGSLINIDKNNFFISRAVNHIPKMIKSNFLNKIKSFIFWLYALMKHNVFFYKMKNNFYN
jgi:hypothetical protein